MIVTNGQNMTMNTVLSLVPGDFPTSDDVLLFFVGSATVLFFTSMYLVFPLP